MSGTASGWVTARLLIVCAALAALFSMHGLPAQSCPGGAGVSGTAMESATVSTPAATRAASPDPGAPGAGMVGTPTQRWMAHGSVVGEMGSGHGGVCVSTTPPRGLDSLIQSLLVTALVVAASAPLPGHGARPGAGRAPPRAGPEVLARLCVSRT